MKKLAVLLSLGLLLLTLAACSQRPDADVQEEAGTQEPDAGVTEDSAMETPGGSDLLSSAEPYIPENNMEPDTAPADTMGEILCDETLPGGLRIVCYWEPESEYTKYWAVRQEGDTLLRFCREESGYHFDYAVEPFSGVLGQEGFRILAPRGAGYFAYDYYVMDDEGVPRLLAGCANEVEEVDLNQDGEVDLRWYSHGGRYEFSYFRRNGQLYLSYADHTAKLDTLEADQP